MYLRDAGPCGKYVCRECRAKIAQGALESLFIKTLESVALEAGEIVDAVEDNPRAAELTRRLGGRQVQVSEVWPLLDQASRCQLVDLLVAQIVVSLDEVSVILADSADSEGEIEPLAPNPLPSPHGSTSIPEQPTSRTSGVGTVNLPPMLTIEEAAAVLRTTVKAVYSRIDRGQLPGVKRVGRRLLIQRDELLGWMGGSRASSPEERRP
jgi:excisionase family DNA binding protein